MNEDQVPTETDKDDFFAEARAAGIARANALKAQAAEEGLHFRAYLPPSLATWLLDKIASGTFVDPSEAVFVMLGEQRELEPHADLRDEILRRGLQAAMDDPRSGIPIEQVMATLKARLTEPRLESARWDAEVSAPGLVSDS